MRIPPQPRDDYAGECPSDPGIMAEDRFEFLDRFKEAPTDKGEGKEDNATV